MPRLSVRRFGASFAIGLALVGASSCHDGQGETTRVVVIGATPKMADPARGPLGPSDAVLVSNTAQGLVSYDAAGNIVGGLAERWNVSDDGLSYIFRLAPAKWSDGSKVTAEQVAKGLNRIRADGSRDELRDTLGAVEDIVAMTDRVIEIRLVAPRPNLLALLAQPEFAIMRSMRGTGPFALEKPAEGDSALKLMRVVPGDDDRERATDRISLAGAPAERAISDFLRGEADLVLGGTFNDLPLTQRVKLARGALRFDPVSGLFGLVPLTTSGPLASSDARQLLSQAIDRDAFANALGVPGLVSRATLLEAGLDGIAVPQPPAWTATPPQARQQANAKTAQRLFGKAPPPIRIYFPVGAGSDLLFHELEVDWGAIGLKVERARSLRAADFALVDRVAPSSSPAWFIRQFRCDLARVCDPALDALTDQARSITVPAQRYALLSQAAAIADKGALFIPITAPVRWSLASDSMAAFKTNRFALHTLVGLQQVPNAQD